MSQPPHISDDGMWRWDGERWVPNQPPQPPSRPPEPRRKSHRGRNLGVGCGGSLAALVLIIVLIVVASSHSGGSTTNRGTASKPAPTAQAQSCQQPCAVENGVTMTVANVVYGADPGQYSPPQPGTVYATMTVTATNKGDSEYNLNPYNFVLQDSKGIKHTFYPMMNDPGTEWQAVNLTKGASQTEKLSFQTSADAPTGMTLVWTPAGFGGDHNIKVS